MPCILVYTAGLSFKGPGIPPFGSGLPIGEAWGRRGKLYRLLVVSAGGAFARLHSQRLPSNVLLFERVPQVEVLSQVDAVISHGGNNTVNETLAAGKPLLVMPVGGEQGDNASRVVYLGVGLRANVKRATSQEIGAKIDRLLEEPTFRQRAEEIAGALAQTQGPVTAARFIERVAQTRRSLLRPEGYPLTVTRETVPPWDFRDN